MIVWFNSQTSAKPKVNVNLMVGKTALCRKKVFFDQALFRKMKMFLLITKVTFTL